MDPGDPGDKIQGQMDLVTSLETELHLVLDIPKNGMAKYLELLEKTEAIDHARLNGIEGMAAKLYWSALATFLERNWGFQERTGRDSQDPVNAVLNYAYGMMYHTV